MSDHKIGAIKKQRGMFYDDELQEALETVVMPWK